MARQVVILHGWSDTSKSFRPLASFLDRHGFQAVPLWLGDYKSLEDDVQIEDVAKRFEAVVREKISQEGLVPPFDLVVHSTGGLVAREWLAAYYRDGAACPAKRVVMLAPANFGSRLASVGQSMLGRVVKGWNNWFRTGKQMLTALELASPFTWRLAERDLFVHRDAAESPYGEAKVWPFVITGTHPYGGKLRAILNEYGADGTIRAAAANLNARGVTVDFSRNEQNPEITPWSRRHGEWAFPLAVLPDRDHTSIVDPLGKGYAQDPATQGLLGKLLLAALHCETFAEYRRLSAITPRPPGSAPAWRSVLAGNPTWGDITEATAGLARDETERKALFRSPPAAAYFHQYLQVVVRVVDDHDQDVADYFLEFYAPESRGDAETVYFQRQVLEHVHPFGPNESYRCLYVDRTDLVEGFYPRIPPQGRKELAMSISAAPPGDNVGYFANWARGAAGEVVVHRADETDPAGRWLKRNGTHLVKIVIPRVPADRVLALQKLPPGSR